MTFHSIAAAASFLALTLAGSAVAAEVAPAAKPQRQCFWSNNVTSFSAVDDDTVNVRVGVKDIYQLELFGHCPDVDWTHEIALISRGGSSICSGMDATIVVKSAIGPRRCPVKTVRKLSAEEIAALNPKDKP